MTVVPCHSRGEGGVNFGSKVVGVEDKHADHERQEDHDEEHHELEDVFNSAPQGNLQWAKTFIGREDVGNPGEAQDNCDGVQPLRDQLGV